MPQTRRSRLRPVRRQRVPVVPPDDDCAALRECQAMVKVWSWTTTPPKRGGAAGALPTRRRTRLGCPGFEGVYYELGLEGRCTAPCWSERRDLREQRDGDIVRALIEIRARANDADDRRRSRRHRRAERRHLRARQQRRLPRRLRDETRTSRGRGARRLRRVAAPRRRPGGVTVCGRPR